jgi:ferredoxin-NADP reductase
MSMLRALCTEGYARPITFVHFARTKADAIYAEELRALEESHSNLRVVTVLTREGAKRRHLTGAAMKTICPEYLSAETFVCGPNALIEAAESIWARGSRAGNLHTETFKLPEPVVNAADATGSVTFARSGVSVENDGQSLLLQAEQGSLSPRHGCRMGICHTCVCRVESGTVRHVRTGEVKSLNNELVQICVNAPVGDIEIDL